MTGLTAEIELTGMQDALDAFTALGDIGPSALDIAIGVAKASTHERLRETKTAPDGTPWADWSLDYARTRGAHHSLLMNEGNLDDSIAAFQSGDVGGVGTNLVYAARQQFGDENMPGRPFLGLSDEDTQNIRFEIEEFISRKAVLK